MTPSNYARIAALRTRSRVSASAGAQDLDGLFAVERMKCMGIVNPLKRHCQLLVLAMFAIYAVPPRVAEAHAPSASSAVAISYAPAEAIRLAEKVADHQLQLYADGPAGSHLAAESFKETGWIQGALFVGLRDLADRSENPKYKEAILARGRFTHWKPGSRPYHADDHVIGQAYLWAARHGAGIEALQPLRARFDQILAAPPVDVALQHGERGVPGTPDCKKRWCWSDALFMAPPAWIELSAVTGDPKYAEYAKAEFLAVSAHLFDKTEHLYYRDSRFFDRKGAGGEKVFWSRGNGWVYAGLARLIPMLPASDPARIEMEAIFKQLSVRLLRLQKADGYWSPSLLADPAGTRPETSGTGFFTYGMAWGIKAGLLDRDSYEPAVRKGWSALVRAVHPDGLIGYVQPVGDRPDNVSYDDTQFYGGGAFLLAATAVADLRLTPGPDLTVTSAAPQPQAVLNVRVEGTEKSYRLKNRYTVPADYKVGSGLIAFEGLGWESDVVAYRLYLDERMAIDIFGKKTPGNVLHTIGTGGPSYHAMAPWGMDILNVGQGVGIGGLGRLLDGKAVRLGKSTISVVLDNTNTQQATAEVKNAGLDEGRVDLLTRLSIRSGSALTVVSANAVAQKGGVDAPFVTGLVVHPAVAVLQEGPDETGWAYIATWGMQSLAKDGLGLAVFYRSDSVAGAPVNDGSTLFVAFNDPEKIAYAFGIAWTQDQQGVKSLPEFRSWLLKRRYELAGKQGKQ